MRKDFLFECEKNIAKAYVCMYGTGPGRTKFPANEESKL